MKFPKAIGACADLLYKLKEKRLAAQHALDAMKKDENELKEHIILTLPKSSASGVAGKVARVGVTVKEVPQVEDWDAFYGYVKRKGAFELLQRRLSDKAIEERLENGEKVPGVKMFKVPTVSINKV